MLFFFRICLHFGNPWRKIVFVECKNKCITRPPEAPNPWHRLTLGLSGGRPPSWPPPSPRVADCNPIQPAACPCCRCTSTTSPAALSTTGCVQGSRNLGQPACTRHPCCALVAGLCAQRPQNRCQRAPAPCVHLQQSGDDHEGALTRAAVVPHGAAGGRHVRDAVV